MKNMYDWVPWFGELAKRVAEMDGPDLMHRAGQVRWKADGSPPPLMGLGDEQMDPFSFFYTLATYCSGREDSRREVCQSVNEAFEFETLMAIDSDEAFIFPRGVPQNTLFHEEGTGDPLSLWRLFRSAVNGTETVDSKDFRRVLEIRNVGPRKLTQTLLLINAREFIPFDKGTCRLLVNPAAKLEDWDTYLAAIGEFRDTFPGCEFYEINLFAYLLQSRRISVGRDFYQVSTNVYADNEDKWQDFVRANAIWTGGPGNRISWERHAQGQQPSSGYPLQAPESGDLIIVRYANYGRGIGIVYKNDYRNELSEQSQLHILWLNKSAADPGANWSVQPGFGRARAIADTFASCDAYRSTFDLVKRLSQEAGRKEVEVADPSRATGNTDPASLSVGPLNRILYGPPGTGKTWSTVGHALAIIDGSEDVRNHDADRFRELRFDPKSGSGNIAIITFHQNFAYEDFVEGIRPVLDGAELRYERHDGLFKRLAAHAAEHREERFVLIIDEINRGNIAKTFGELITLIEDSRRIGRAEETWVSLPYSKEDFGVPDNLYLVGTMNTADRSIQLLDAALRRRFTFFEMMPNPDHDDVPTDVGGVDCRRLLKVVNERIAALLDREHQIGHTYFLDVVNMDELSRRFRHQVFPLLQEYFFDDWSKIRAVLGNSPFVEERSLERLFQVPDLVEEDRRVYERLPDEDQRWRSPAAYQAIYEGRSESPSDTA